MNTTKIFREFILKKANNENIDNYVSDFGKYIKRNFTSPRK